MLLSSLGVALLIALILLGCRLIAYYLRSIEALEDRHYLAVKRCAEYRASLARLEEEELRVHPPPELWVMVPAVESG